MKGQMFDPRVQQGPLDLGMVAEQARLMDQQQAQQARAASIQLAIGWLGEGSNTALIEAAKKIHLYITEGK